MDLRNVNNLPEVLQDYFTEKSSSLSLARLSILVFRNDGILLYSNHSQHVSEMSALAAGLWQAANSLFSFHASALMNNNEQSLQLNYFTSSEGIIIHPLHEEFFLLAVYNDEENPGKLRYEVKKMAEELSEIYFNTNENTNRDKYNNNQHFFSESEIEEAFKLKLG